MTDLNVVSEEDTMAAAYDQITADENTQDSPAIDAPEAVSEEVEEGLAGTDEQDTPQESVEPPASWTAEAKEQFAQLPPEMQKIISDREAQREKAINQSKAELAELRKSTSGLEGVTQKHGQYLQQLGMSADQAFDTLMTAEYTLRNGSPQEKAQLFQQLAQDYGVPIQGVDPNNMVSQLSHQVNTLKQELGMFKSQQEQSVVQETTKLVENFASAKDEQGNLLHPHFDDVVETMIKLKTGGVSDNLDDLYKQAVQIVPEVRAKVEQEHKTREAKLAAEKANKAKTQASTKSRGVPKDMIGKSETVEDTMARIYDELNGA